MNSNESGLVTVAVHMLHAGGSLRFTEQSKYTNENKNET